MSSRRNLPPQHEERVTQGSGMTRRCPPDPMASQRAEMESIAADNHRLATSIQALRLNLVTAQQEAEKLRDHIRSLRTEGDIQIRILLEKIGKMEADVKAGNGLKNELREAHREAQGLVISRAELTSQIQQATRELDNARADIKKLPDIHVELDNSKQEHQRLRKTFEQEKSANVEKVEQMKNLEKDLIAMAEEVERLHGELANAEKRAAAPVPYPGPYANSANIYPPPPLLHGNGGYVNSFNGPVGVPVMDGPNFYPGNGFAVGPPVVNGPTIVGGFTFGPPVVNGPTGGGYPIGPPVMNGPAAGGGGGGFAWGGAYDASHTQR